jgi:carbamoyl-phosphate synthase large subunit
LRASRSVPFVSKVLKRNFIETATEIMLDAPYTMPDSSVFDLEHIGVKASQFSFSRLHNFDPILGVDMSSTGEVGCLGDDVEDAMLKSMIAVGYTIPKKGILISSGEAKSKVDLLDACKLLHQKGYKLYASHGTQKFLEENGIDAIDVNWPDEDGDNNILQMIANKGFDLIINIPKNVTKRELTNGYIIRRNAVDYNIPLITNARLASAFIKSFCNYQLEDLKIKSWDQYSIKRIKK